MAVVSSPHSFAELQTLFREKESEEEALRRDIELARCKAQRLRLQLAAVGVSDSLIPANFRTGHSIEDTLPLRRAIKELIEWLSERIDMSASLPFCVKGDLPLGDISVDLGRMISWNIAGTGQRLSVPADLESEIAHVFAKTRARNHRASEEDVSFFADTWSMLGTQLAISADSAVPAIILHQDGVRAIVVAEWPSIEAPEIASAPKFDPAKHFASVLSGPVSSLTVGARVVVKYEGEWYEGVLEQVDGGLAEVQCDVDEPGTVTIARASDIFAAPKVFSCSSSHEPS